MVFFTKSELTEGTAGDSVDAIWLVPSFSANARNPFKGFRGANSR